MRRRLLAPQQVVDKAELSVRLRLVAIDLWTTKNAREVPLPTMNSKVLLSSLIAVSLGFIESCTAYSRQSFFATRTSDTIVLLWSCTG